MSISSRAFTLVELMIVIAIIGILAAALFPSMTEYMARARDSATQSNIRRMVPILQNHLIDVGSFVGMSPDLWYCVPLKGGSTCSPNIPNFPAIPITVKEFTIQEGGVHPNPLIINALNSNFGHVQLLGSRLGQSTHILHWSLPGSRGYTGPHLSEPTDQVVANTRCSPGVVRSINSVQTICHMIIH